MIDIIKRNLVKTIKWFNQEYSKEGVHRYHKHKANNALKNIEKYNGRLNLKCKKLADEYALEVLGDKKYSPWLYVFCLLRNTFIEGWIPENYYDLIVKPQTDGRYCNLAGIKTMTNRILNTDSIPDTSYLIDGILYSNTFNPVGPENALNTIFKDCDTVFFKKNDSAAGQGVEKIVKDSFKLSEVLSRNDGCFQSRINPHDFFKEIVKNSTSTIRITTVKDHSGKISARAAYLRVGRADDSFVKSKTAIKIPVELSSGLLGEFGYMSDYKRSEKHADSGFLFAGKKIPYYSDAINLCILLHGSFPHFTLIGWDVCIDQNNKVKIMEWNANGADIVFSEATTGPCFMDLRWEDLWKKAGQSSKP